MKEIDLNVFIIGNLKIQIHLILVLNNNSSNNNRLNYIFVFIGYKDSDFILNLANKYVQNKFFANN